MSDLPLHIEIANWSIILSTAVCFLLALGGQLWKHCTHALPPVPLFPGSSFPHFVAVFYTAFFTITFAMLSIKGAAPAPEATRAELVLSMLIQIALYVPLLVVYFSLPRRELPVTPIWCKAGWVLLALFVIGGCSILLEISGLNRWIVEQTNCPPQQDVVESILKGDRFEKAVICFMAVIVAPIAEECFFRGCIYNILKQCSTRWMAALASALLFSAIHASLPQFLPLFIFGLVQCVAYEKARSLWLPVVIHFTFNLGNILLLFIFPHLT
ncbi:MAG: CPBP family intramembrane metalloprotease [Akkermansia sp.]|nr:CPBP family intramembrane metalloprotease [Akkermansia sp.]